MWGEISAFSASSVTPGLSRASTSFAATKVSVMSPNRCRPCLRTEQRGPAMTKMREPLAPGLAAAGGFGFLDRAEPARALGDVHLDLGVPAAGRLVIDAFARGVDVALDGAVGRG